MGAEVDNTERIKLQRQLASVGQTASRKGLAQLQAVLKTAEYTVSCERASAALFESGLGIRVVVRRGNI